MMFSSSHFMHIIPMFNEISIHLPSSKVWFWLENFLFPNCSSVLPHRSNNIQSCSTSSLDSSPFTALESGIMIVIMMILKGRFHVHMHQPLSPDGYSPKCMIMWNMSVKSLASWTSSYDVFGLAAGTLPSTSVCLVYSPALSLVFKSI